MTRTVARAALPRDDTRPSLLADSGPDCRFALADVVLKRALALRALVAGGELLHLHTCARERFTITHRLNDLEARLDPRRFVRLSRSALAAVDVIASVSPMPGGTYVVRLRTCQQLAMSRLRARVRRAGGTPYWRARRLGRRAGSCRHHTFTAE